MILLSSQLGWMFLLPRRKVSEKFWLSLNELLHYLAAEIIWPWHEIYHRIFANILVQAYCGIHFYKKMLHSHWKVSFHRLAHCCAIFLWATNYSWVTFQLICHWRILSGVNLKCAGWSPDVKSRKGQSSRNQQSFPADLANCLFLLPGNIRRTTWNFVFVMYIYICCDKQFFF